MKPRPPRRTAIPAPRPALSAQRCTSRWSCAGADCPQTLFRRSEGGDSENRRRRPGRSAAPHFVEFVAPRWKAAPTRATNPRDERIPAETLAAERPSVKLARSARPGALQKGRGGLTRSLPENTCSFFENLFVLTMRVGAGTIISLEFVSAVYRRRV